MERVVSYIFRVGIVLLVSLGLLCIATVVDVATFSCKNVPSDVNVAIVLGSSVEEGAPSTVFKGRLEEALSLYLRKQVSFILVTGGVTTFGQPSEARAGATYLSARGVPPDRVIEEERAMNTRENLMFSVEEVSRRGLGGWLVVSDPYHLRRASVLAHELGYPFACVGVSSSSRNTVTFLFRECQRITLVRIQRFLRRIE